MTTGATESTEWSRSIALAGAGRVGQALGRLLVLGGAHVAAVWSRDGRRARRAAAFIGGAARATGAVDLPRCAARILIATSDQGIGWMARTLASSGARGCVVLHTSGALDSSVLAPLAEQGASCGSLHPLQTVAAPRQGVRDLPGSAFAAEGDARAVAWAGEIVELVHGKLLRLAPGAKPLYHAAAVLASNAVTGLAAAAADLMRLAGVEQQEALDALRPLLCASAANAVSMGPAAALTGPAERGDWQTVERHWAALEAAPGAARALYRAATLQILALARTRHGPLDAYDRMERLLRRPETAS